MSNIPLRIGIPVWEKDKVFSYRNYFHAMEILGTNPVCIGKDDKAEDFDGLLMPGGYDVDPSRYGEANQACWGIDPEFDDLQLTVLDHFVKAKKAVMGICRGHQLINVYLGGTLIQHLPTADLHHHEEGQPDLVNSCHAVPGSVVYQLYGERFPVNSNHHQAINRPGKGVKITLWSDDGVPEAAEVEGMPIFSVQFHPERMCFTHARPDTVDGSLILRRFLENCRNEK